jgi:hypothetical protein
VKREATGSTKMKKLCRLLDIRMYEAIGILESLWHLTAREAPQGDIGKLSNEDIALGLDWRDDPEKLITALLDARWLDMSRHVRLVVHDWHEHADESVKRKLVRNGLSFLSVESCLGAALQSSDVNRLPGAGAGPSPVPGPEPGEAIPPVAGGKESLTDPEANIPSGLSMVQYRQFVCEQLSAAKSYSNQVVFQDAIEAVMSNEHVPVEVATKTVIDRARDHPPADGVWRFWVNDGGWKAKTEANGGSNQSITRQRVDSGVGAVAKYLAGRGIGAPGNAGSPDGAAVPEPGTGAVPRGIHVGLRTTGGETLGSKSGKGAGGVANTPRAEILPKA